MLLLRLEKVPALAHRVGHIDRGERIGAFDYDGVTRLCPRQSPPGPQGGQRTFEAAEIEEYFGHGSFWQCGSRTGECPCRASPFLRNVCCRTGRRAGPAPCTGMKVIGISGWSGSGKTVLITRLIPVLRASGLRIATIKHAHHAFDIDIPGKDSFEHRAAGASEVIVASVRRVAQIEELTGNAEPRLTDLLRRLSPCDLVLVEGFKHEAHAKLEVFRAANQRPPLHPNDPTIVAIASDRTFPEARLPQVDIDDLLGIADLVTRHACEVEALYRRLERDGAAQR